MVVARWYRPSGWLEGMRLLRGRFKGEGAVGEMSPFPVAGSPETSPPGPVLKQTSFAAIGLHWNLRLRRMLHGSIGRTDSHDHH
jgi:hypothetical protein